MDQTERLLQSILENARLGESACDQLIARAKEKEIRQELMQQKQQYASIAQKAEEKIYNLGLEPHPKGMLSRMGLWMGMQINTAVDRSGAHIAEICFQGAQMGIAEITKAINSNPEADGEAKGIAAAMLEGQQQAANRVKPFLKQKSMV